HRLVTVGYSLSLDLALPNVPRGTLVSANLRRFSPFVDGGLAPFETFAIGHCTLIRSARSLTVIWSECIRPSLRGLFARGSMQAPHFRVATFATCASMQKCEALWGEQYWGKNGFFAK